jgi:hypothetical protein
MTGTDPAGNSSNALELQRGPVDKGRACRGMEVAEVYVEGRPSTRWRGRHLSAAP